MPSYYIYQQTSFKICLKYIMMLQGLSMIHIVRNYIKNIQIKMMDLVEEIESYSPQTGQSKPSTSFTTGSQGAVAKAPLIQNGEHQIVEQKEQPLQQENKSCFRFFKQKYYEEYFKVSESDVLFRITSAIIPPFKQNFMQSIEPNPDLYGPLWISTTIVVLLGTVGNLSNYIYSKFSSQQKWNGYFFELQLIRYAFVMIYCFGIGVPALLYFILKFMGDKIPLPNLICAYGYANMCFVLAIILCIFPISFLQWILMIYAFANSSLFLIVSLRKSLQGMGKKQLPIFVVVLAIQLTLFLCIKLIFIVLK